jgi:alpha-galactosidase
MQMALWGIAPSPLFFGGDLTRMDAFTYSLLTNTDLLWLNNAATKSEEIRQNNSSGVRIWRAQRQGMALIGLPRQHNVTMYVAVFNTGSAPANEALSAADFGAQLDPDTNCGVVDVWTGMHIGSLQGSGLLKVNVSSHDVTVLRAECLQAL